MNFDTLFPEINSERSNFLARVLGIFSEDIVKFWSANNKCIFENVGRPDIYDSAGKRKAQLDFTLKSKVTGQYYIVEQKTLVAYRNGKLLNMCNNNTFHQCFESWSNGKTNRTLAWKLFLGPLTDYTVKVKGVSLLDFGKILIWPKVDIDAKRIIEQQYAIDEILSFEQIHNDLISWNDFTYVEWLEKRIKWTNELFNQFTS